MRKCLVWYVCRGFSFFSYADHKKQNNIKKRKTSSGNCRNRDLLKKHDSV